MGNAQGVVLKIMNNKFKDDHAIKDLIKYILTDKKTKDIQKYVGGVGVDYLNYLNVVKQFAVVQRCFAKERGRKVYHMVISFPEGFDDLYTACILAERVTHILLEGYQCVYAVHENTDNLHIHIGWNSVNYKTGKKWHMGKKDLEEMKRLVKIFFKEI